MSDGSPLWVAVRWTVWALCLAAGGVLFGYHATLVRGWFRGRSTFPKPLFAIGFVIALVAWAALPNTSRARFLWPTRLVILSEGLVWLLLFEPVLFWMRRRGGWDEKDDDAPPDA